MNLMQTLQDLIAKPALAGAGNVTQQAGQGLGQVAQPLAQAGASAPQAIGAMSPSASDIISSAGRAELRPDSAPALAPEGELTPWQQRAQAAAPIVSKMGERKQGEMGAPPPLPVMQGMTAPQMVQSKAMEAYKPQGWGGVLSQGGLPSPTAPSPYTRRF